ncbi:MAG TPA: ribonuclease E activity regulator RraA, partial [Gammaproteobacteria bacterium]|nr:ribonuclease E activity regulator RraA [Gammaproteobacteria bacterium]
TLTKFRHFGGKKAFHGEIQTIKCFEDNSFVKKELSKPSESGVLIVDGESSNNCALLGDLLAQMAKDNGWAGIIINGYVRDIEILRAIDIGVMALGACPRKSEKRDQGMRNLNIEIDDVIIKPGYWCYADENGVLISKPKLDFN